MAMSPFATDWQAKVTSATAPLGVRAVTLTIPTSSYALPSERMDSACPGYHEGWLKVRMDSMSPEKRSWTTDSFAGRSSRYSVPTWPASFPRLLRSEEHTSELQSRQYLV